MGKGTVRGVVHRKAAAYFKYRAHLLCPHPAFGAEWHLQRRNGARSECVHRSAGVGESDPAPYRKRWDARTLFYFGAEMRSSAMLNRGRPLAHRRVRLPSSHCTLHHQHCSAAPFSLLTGSSADLLGRFRIDAPMSFRGTHEAQLWFVPLYMRVSVKLRLCLA